MGVPQMQQIAGLIDRAVGSRDNADALDVLRAEAEELCREFPLYPGL
jgi:glycine/serine hydroxymethyltransferase